MIIESKRIYIISEFEFDVFALKLIDKLGIEAEDSDPWGEVYSPWRFSRVFGTNNTIWPKVEKSIKATYTPAKGPKGCHIIEFNTEGDRLHFQLKYGDLLYG